MSQERDAVCRLFLSYSGVGLPLNLISPIDEADTKNRNTWMRGYYDAEGRLLACEKVVYGEIELSHRYAYHPDGSLSSAEVSIAGEDTTLISYDSKGKTLSMETL